MLTKTIDFSFYPNNTSQMKNKLFWLLVSIFAFGAIYYCYPETKLPINTKIDTIIIFKSKRELQIFFKKKLLKTYKIALGANSVGHKHFEGDEKTPEGSYSIYKLKTSIAYKSLHINYPKIDDKNYAKNHFKKPGGNICIHGIKNGFGFLYKFHRFYDWTDGCIAVNNKEMDEIYNSVNSKTIVIIKP